MFKTYIFISVFISLSLKSQGLQLSLDYDVPTTQTKRTACGVLTCLERSHDTTASSQSTDSSSSISSMISIAKMTVYKTDGPRAQGITDEAILVAYVDSQQPRVIRVANAMKVDGRLESSVTTIRVELFKQEDCRAGFTCEVLAVDASGREVVRTSNLLQQASTQGSVGTSQQGWTPAVAMHLVNLVQELNTNMELMRSHMDGYNDRLSELVNIVDTLEKETSSSVSTLEKGVSSELRRLENRIEDKLERFEDKVTQMKDASASTALRISDKINIIDDSIRVLINSIKSDKQATVAGNQINEDSMLQCLNVSAINKNLVLLATSMKEQTENNHESLQQVLESRDALLNRNLRLFFTRVFENSNITVLSLEDRFDSFEGRMEERFIDLASNINKSVDVTRSSIEEIVGNINVTDASEIAFLVTGILTTKTCKKGMVSLLTQSSYPYPVVKPSSDDSLAVPYLCDTITDGGGWIIIQRRSSGNVDFYRNWADYKRGFGTLDDDFWLGNDNIHAITSSGDYELRIDLKYNGKSFYAHYNRFSIADEQNKYTISLGVYDGTAGGDSLAVHRGKSFTTFDQDNDEWSGNCAVQYTGAWWYEHCHDSNLNGKWAQNANKGPRWGHFSGANAVSFTEMKIRKI
ncbi:tenascin-R [Elysia marginata]|uniref:Tenascin-R n=1 Tax=Elysia marginata TaxID=1093978 RepID=A0AAV4FEZ4_9GAST|nr:tenascin-R [Elysia marginata]